MAPAMGLRGAAVALLQSAAAAVRRMQAVVAAAGLWRGRAVLLLPNFHWKARRQSRLLQRHQHQHQHQHQQAVS